MSPKSLQSPPLGIRVTVGIIFVFAALQSVQGNAIAQTLPTRSQNPDSPALTLNPGRFATKKGEIEVVAELVATNPQVADPVQFLLIVDGPPGMSIVLPPVTESFGDFSVLDSQRTNDVPLGGNSSARRSQMTLSLESFVAGICKTPTIEVIYQGPSTSPAIDGGSEETSSQGSIKIPSLSIQIASVLSDTDSPDQFRDIKAAIETPEIQEPSNRGLVLTIAAVATLVIFIGVFLRWRYRTPRPGDWALKAIADLETNFQQGQPRSSDVYAQLSLVMRRYLQLSLDTPARAFSTAELASELAEAGFSQTSIDSARRVLETADAYKFSPSEASKTENSHSPFDDVRSVIAESEKVIDVTTRLKRKPNHSSSDPLPSSAKAEA